MDAARLDEPNARPPRIRAAVVLAATGLWNELHHREVPAGRSPPRNVGAEGHAVLTSRVLRRDQPGRYDSGIVDPLAAHRTSRSDSSADFKMMRSNKNLSAAPRLKLVAAAIVLAAGCVPGPALPPRPERLVSV